MPARVVAYRPQVGEAYAKLRLESGETIAVSIGSGTFRIDKLALGFVPTKTLLKLGATDVETFELLFVPLGMDGEELAKRPMLDHVVNALLPCRTVQDVLRRLDPQYHALSEVQRVTQDALQESTFADACKRTAHRFKIAFEGTLRHVRTDEDRARVERMIARCNTVLAGDDVFTEEELVALERLGAQAEAGFAGAPQG